MRFRFTFTIHPRSFRGKTSYPFQLKAVLGKKSKAKGMILPVFFPRRLSKNGELERLFNRIMKISQSSGACKGPGTSSKHYWQGIGK